jgi:hypothetical protein
MVIRQENVKHYHFSAISSLHKLQWKYRNVSGAKFCGVLQLVKQGMLGTGLLEFPANRVAAVPRFCLI